MRSLEVTVVSRGASDSPDASPLGAACIVASLAASLPEGVELRLLDVPHTARAAEIARVASLPRDGGQGLHAIGFSVYVWNRLHFCEAAKLARAADPALILFAGGPEASADPDGLLEEGGFDFIVVGEGEGPTTKAIAAILSMLGGVDGAQSRAELLSGIRVIGGILVRGQAQKDVAQRVMDAADLVSPWLSRALLPEAGGAALWELSRGCPYRCSYCYESKGGRGLRRLPLGRLEAELELFARSGVAQVFVLDPTFNADRERAMAILDLIAQKAPEIRFKFEVRSELLDKAQARRFAEIDCSLQIGLQSAAAGVLARLGREFERKAFARKIGLLNASGATFGLDLIYGLPGEGLRGFREAIDFALGLQPNHLDIFPLAVLPGTELFDRAAEFGLDHDPRPPYLVRSTPELPAGDFAKAASLAAACQRFYSEGRAVAWFLQALRPLKITPSAFLTRFAESLGKGQAPSPSIPEAQLGFLHSQYEGKRLSGIIPALGDIVRFHAAWGRAIAEGASTVLELRYDPDEVLGPAAYDLASFARSARPSAARIRVSPVKGGGAHMERLGHGKGRSAGKR